MKLWTLAEFGANGAGEKWARVGRAPTFVGLGATSLLSILVICGVKTT
jgi:hypothetical protein